MIDLVRNRFQPRYSNTVNICKADRSYVCEEDKSEFDCPCCVGVKITLVMQTTLIEVLRAQQLYHVN